MKIFIYSLLVSYFIGTILNAEIIHVPADASTIQEGIDFAVTGDVVLVDEGIYYENIDFKGKAITVASMFIFNNNLSIISNTVIDGSKTGNTEKGSVVRFTSGEDTNSVIYGFTIRGGTGTLVEEEKIKRGGGILCLESGASILYNRIEDNTIRATSPSFGAGIGHGPPQDKSFLIIENNKINHNTIKGDVFCSGGAIDMYCYGRIANNTINDNLCKSVTDACNGGGLSAQGKYSDAAIQVLDNTFLNNKALSAADHYQGGSGGGLWIGGYSDSEISGNRIQNNQVSSKQQSLGAGAILHTMDASNIFCGNTIMFNSSTDIGAGKGGGVCLWKSYVSLFNNIICFNRSTYGGGIYMFGESDNINEESSFSLFNNTIVSNYAEQEGGGIYGAYSDPIIINSIIWDNSAKRGAGIYNRKGSFDIRYSNVQDGRDYNQNLNTDPLFTSSFFQLSDSSPCIGAGIDVISINGQQYSCPSCCYMGEPRPSPAESMPDMGACENRLEVGISDIQYLDSNIPQDFNLKQNFPNPFNPETKIEFSVPISEFVTLKIFDSIGREVATLISENLAAGNYTSNWNASEFSSGVYFYKIEAGNYVNIKKLVLMK